MSIDSDSAAIVIDDLTLGYQRHPAVHHVDCRIETGSLTALIGPNGAGKTTLLRGLAGELAPFTGQITSNSAGKTAFLPQMHNIDFAIPLSVEEAVAMGLWQRIGIEKGIGKHERQMIADALQAVKLRPGDRRQLGELSGGVLQRVLFARMMLRDADVILLDEPFQSVDERTTSDLLDVVVRWHEEGKTVIVSLHDLDLVRTRFPQAMLLARELLCHGPAAKIATVANLERARGMCAGFDEKAKVCEHKSKMPGFAENPNERASGVSSPSLYGN